MEVVDHANSLKGAARKLLQALDRKPVGWTREIGLRIQKFVESVVAVPHWHAELDRRAIFVPSQCGEHSNYRRSMSLVQKNAALDNVGDLPAKRAVRKLKAIDGVPCRVGELVSVVNLIHFVLEADDPRAKSFADTREALTNWQSICLRLADDASAFKADGCRWLLVYERSQRSDASDETVAEAVILRSKLGRSAIRDIATAVRAFTRWALNNPPENGTRVPATRGKNARRLMGLLLKHHGYSGEDSLLENATPISVRQAAQILKVKPGSISRAFTSLFPKKEGKKGYKRYVPICKAGEQALLTEFMSLTDERPSLLQVSAQI